MSSRSEVAAASSLVRDTISFSRLPWIRPLVHAYATDFASVSTLFPGDPGQTDAWRAAVARTQRASARRTSIAPILDAQLARRAAPAEARAAAARLARPEAVAVVTGQQAGVFGGPFYTVLKAISTILVAQHVRETCGVDAVPVFWVDAEDHDWNEVRSAHVIDRDFTVSAVSAPDVPGAGTQPVGRLTFDAGISTTIDALLERLAETEHSPWLDAILKRRYQPGVRPTVAFAGLLDDLLGGLGLVVFEADDPAAKLLVGQLFSQELARPCDTARLALAGGDAMSRLGHAPQIVPTEDTVSLFYLDERGRRPIRYRDGAFVVGDESWTAEAIAAAAAATPERFSPNVLLRPLVQDTLFPTVCYVGGPSELAYQVQLAGVYAAFGLERPILVSRASATIVDSAALKFLERRVLPFEALQPQDESALNRVLEGQLPTALDATFTELDTIVSGRAADLKTIATTIDSTLAGAVDTTVDRMRETLKTLQGKIVQAAKKKDDTTRRQFIRTRTLTFPSGHPQERLLNTTFFLNRYGPDLPARLLGALPVLPDAHLVLMP